jgi:aminopeptidase N
MRNLFFVAVVAAFYLACTPKSGSKVTETPITPTEPTTWDTLTKPEMANGEEEEPLEYNMMEGTDIFPETEPQSDSLAPYNASHTFEHDLIHTKVEISFDWANKHAIGKTTLTLRPWFYATDQVSLDAKNFDIKSIKLLNSANIAGDALKYDYDGEVLTVKLGKMFTRNDEFKLLFDYIAKPDDRNAFGGSAAIQSDKGLFFINADGSEKDKPMQIWTQGETENNSRWMPTIDKPNERCTQEMYITVADKFKTLSNGVMVSSKKNTDGTRTDYWKMDKPHAPYLFMMAIGEFAVVKDKWRGIDVEYYVEPKYEAYARDIFPHTPEMLEFFSNKLGYPYPWQKYAQVVVREYVSGAMENTSAVIFGDFMQKNKRELADQYLTNEGVVAHEMFHHWFGDLVTTESWANLTLNEGFANYSEYLWLEHKYGKDQAEAHAQQEREGYILSAADGGHPLIHFGYDNREDMFDGHSYNKGGATLHMLRTEIGDDAFFAALKHYLKKHEYTDVEAHELRMAFEEVTGRDMSWFWNQWFFSAGHPNLEISYNWDEATKQAAVTIAQTQEAIKGIPYVYNLPLFVDIYDENGKARREKIQVTKRTQTFFFSTPSKPAVINTDAQKALLCIKNDQHTPEEWAALYRFGPHYRDRLEALDALKREKSDWVKQVFTEALNDKFYGLRKRAIQRSDLKDASVMARIAKMAENDPSNEVRATALTAIGKADDKQYVPVLQKCLGSELPYSVVGAAIAALAKVDPASALVASKALENDDSEAISNVLADLYSESPSRENLPFFEKRLDKMDMMAALGFFAAYQKALVGIGDDNLIDAAINRLKDISMDAKTSTFRRFSATKAISDFKKYFEEKKDTTKTDNLNKLIEDIKAQEKDETLKMYYGMF